MSFNMQAQNLDPDRQERDIIIGLLTDNKLAEATRYSETLVLKYPKSFLLAMSIGMSYALLSEHQKAIVSLERAIALNPNSVDAHCHLGECYLHLERQVDAKKMFEKALTLDPSSSLARKGVIQSMIDPMNFNNSVEDLEAKIEAEPDNPNIAIALGRCYLEQEKYKAAIDTLLKANEVLPEDADLMTLIGEAYDGFHKHKDALEWLHKSLEHQKTRPPYVLMCLANAYKGDGDFDKSVEYAQEAIDLNPEGAAPKNNLAHIYAILGEKKEAATLHKQALKDEPDNIRAIIGLSNLDKVKKGDSTIKILEETYDKETTNVFEEKEKMRVGFALGKVYGDVGEYGKSIECLRYANAKRRELIEFDFEKEIENFDLIKHVFTPITPEDYSTMGKADDRKLIFVFGMPRSGTTLTEQIISSHSKVYGAGELNFMNAETAELMYMFGLQPEVKLEKIAFDHIGPAYLEHIESLKVEERIITDKMPHNFLRLGYILCCFPNAKIIHLNRDPVAVCFSCFQKFFPARGMGFTFNMRDLGLYYGMYLDLMEYWRKKFPGRIFELDYRDLTENQEEQTRILLDYCELSWEDKCLEFYKTKRGVLTASQTQVREKMYQGSSETWKKYKEHLGELLDALDEAGVEYDRA